MRKCWLFLLVMVPLLSQAQDCKLSRETDPFTKEIRLSTGFIFIDGGSVTFDADSKEIDVLFSIEGADRCFDNNSTAYIFFEGVKSKVTVRNGGTMNCEGLFHFIFKNNATTSTPSLLQKLMTQSLDHITFTTTSGKEVVLTVSAADRATVSKMANCLVTEAKTIAR